MATEDEMREALATLRDTVRDAHWYLGKMLTDLEAGKYDPDDVAGDVDYWESNGVWSALDAVVRAASGECVQCGGDATPGANDSRCHECAAEASHGY